MKTRFFTSAISSFVIATTAFAESPALQSSGPQDLDVGKPGSGAPAPLGQIDLNPEPVTKPQIRSTGVSTSRVSQVQRALKQRGFYGGPVDGDDGAGTRAAIRNFKKRNGLPLTAAIDQPLLDALGL